MKDTRLTSVQLHTIISRFQSSCHRLRESGDYPEKKSDKKILDILISMKFDAFKREVALEALGKIMIEERSKS